jgi:hypothetical protein
MSQQILALSKDFEADFVITKRRAVDGVPIPATGLSGMSAYWTLTEGGASVLAIGLTERGATGRYYGVFDTADLVSSLLTAVGTKVYLTLAKSGDVVEHWAYDVHRWATHE